MSLLREKASARFTPSPSHRGSNRQKERQRVLRKGEMDLMVVGRERLSPHPFIVFSLVSRHTQHSQDMSPVSVAFMKMTISPTHLLSPSSLSSPTSTYSVAHSRHLGKGPLLLLVLLLLPRRRRRKDGPLPLVQEIPSCC